MSTNILIVDDDLDVHELLKDILEMTFRDARIDRALTSENFQKKLNQPEAAYQIILLNAQFNTFQQRSLAADIKTRFPALYKRIILLDGDSEEIDRDEALKELPYMGKPFSLDDFQEVIKKVCVD